MKRKIVLFILALILVIVIIVALIIYNRKHNIETPVNENGDEDIANVSMNENVAQEETLTDVENTEEGNEVESNSQSGNVVSENTGEDSASISNSSNSNKPSNSDSSASTNTGASSNQSSQPSHTHSWKSHTAQRWVTNMVTVPDYEIKTINGARFYTLAEDGSFVANGPTYWFENGFTQDNLKDIIKNALKQNPQGIVNGVYYGNYQNVTKTESVQVGSHQEDHGYYETYVDYYYCDCGATKQ